MSILLPKNPEFVAERGMVKEDSKSWDRRLTGIVGVFMLGELVVPGLDLRFGWSPQLPLAIQVLALSGLILGSAFFSWAMLSNAHFETKVRIQRDRGHTVATGGPYQFVRHPGYAGMILQLIVTPVLLGSLWGLIPGVIGACLMVLRTVLEDRTLQSELEGYAEYARRVRFCLFPGVW